MVFRFNSDIISSLLQIERKPKSSSLEFYSANADFPTLPPQTRPLRKFTYQELKEVTENFSESLKIEEGEFGTIYKVVFFQDPDKSIELVVKYLKERIIQGRKECATEVNFVGVFWHLNLVNLFGYCVEDHGERGLQRLLVYEYCPNGSVEHHLSTRTEAPLLWKMRLKLAQDVARGLAHLHRRMIIFEHFSSSSIFFDDEWNAKISYFGLLWKPYDEDLTDVITMIEDTTGYAAPECSQARCHTPTCDTWSYGIFLFELITGRRPLDMNQFPNEQKLLEWLTPYIDSNRFELIIDSRLRGNYPPEAVQELAILASKCLAKNPYSRPDMSEVLTMVDKINRPSSQRTCPLPPLRSLVPMMASKLKKGYICTNKVKKTDCLSCMCPLKLFKSCLKKKYCLENGNLATIEQCTGPPSSSRSLPIMQ